MYRDAEKQFRSALKQQDLVDTYLYLSKVYIRLDQPLAAVAVFKQGLEKFAGETTLLTGIARIHEVTTNWRFLYTKFNISLKEFSTKN